MKLTFVVANLPTHQRATILKYGVRAGDYVTIDSADLLHPAMCGRCGGPHEVDDCPIPADTSPEKEWVKLRRGGCCDPPVSE